MVVPLKAWEMVLYAYDDLIYLPHTESKRNETLRQLSQRWVRFHVDWVNAELDSTSTESTQSFYKLLVLTKLT